MVSISGEEFAFRKKWPPRNMLIRNAVAHQMEDVDQAVAAFPGRGGEEQIIVGEVQAPDARGLVVFHHRECGFLVHAFELGSAAFAEVTPAGAATGEIEECANATRTRFASVPHLHKFS